MKSSTFFYLLLTLFTAISCSSNKNASDVLVEATDNLDYHTYANLSEIKTTHLHLDFNINFDEKIVEGVARHTMENNGADWAIFDVKELSIEKVTLGKEETPTTFELGTNDELLGQALKVKVDQKTEQVNIYYSTTEGCEALDWLEPALTGGKQFPFMYSQGQAILTRSWIPTQDTPVNRITYSADLTVPAELMAIMSADNPTELSPEGRYHFEMKQAIPCYLIAIAVGDIRYRALSENCGVYAEPGMIDASAKEFEDLPAMMKTAERLFGPYQWDQYDVIVLPYSFPFGGMENPRLTFANPTLIAGDKSLVSVIAHELAHSWSGNLVTNATWNDFWLNEGFTVYIENRIMEEVESPEIADMLALIEFQELHQEMQDINASEHPEDTKLKLDLKGRNPDDGMTSVAYVKGAFFLKTLEKTYGREKFDAFLRDYFKEFAFKTLTTEDFVNYLNENLISKNEQTINIDEWIYEEGVPENCALVTSERFKRIQALADKIADGEKALGTGDEQIQRGDYITQEWLAFIRRLPSSTTPEQMRYIDEKLNFKNCGNAEIMSEWFVLGIEVGYEDIKPSMAAFLTKVGRRKFLKPIYSALAETPQNKAWAKKVYEGAKQNYHYVSRNTLEEILA